MGLFAFMRAVGQTGSFSEAYLVRLTGTSINDYQMRTEVGHLPGDHKGPRRIVIHEGRGRSAERDAWGGRWRQDIHDNARRNDSKVPETDFRRPYGQYPPGQSDKSPGWFW